MTIVSPRSMPGTQPDCNPSDQAPTAGNRAVRENFPVAGWFIARRLRPAVAAYYAFARTADDIADDPVMTEDEKVRRLGLISADFTHAKPDTIGGRLRGELDRHAIPLAHAQDLLIAFNHDARNAGIITTQDLSDYCRHSAVPVGRFLMALHHERDGLASSDALCEALQILNHVQDVRKDATEMNRCYIPQDWMDAVGATLSGLIEGDDAALRAHLAYRMLDHAARCLLVARALPRHIRTPRLAAQAAMTFALAVKLERRLRGGDPWTERVALHWTDWMFAAAAGLKRLLT